MAKGISSQDRVSLGDKVIKDFGEQWKIFQDNPRYYGSLLILKGILEPFLPLEELRGKVAVGVGAWAGEFIHSLLKAGVKEVVAVEPSR